MLIPDDLLYSLKLDKLIEKVKDLKCPVISLKGLDNAECYYLGKHIRFAIGLTVYEQSQYDAFILGTSEAEKNAEPRRKSEDAKR